MSITHFYSSCTYHRKHLHATSCRKHCRKRIDGLDHSIKCTVTHQLTNVRTVIRVMTYSRTRIQRSIIAFPTSFFLYYPFCTMAMASQQGRLRLPNVRFRVLIIGKANAGKTSILKRVCNTTESPKIYRLGRWGTRNLVRPRSSSSGEFRSHRLVRLNSSLI